MKPIKAERTHAMYPGQTKFRPTWRRPWALVLATAAGLAACGGGSSAPAALPSGSNSDGGGGTGGGGDQPDISKLVGMWIKGSTGAYRQAASDGNEKFVVLAGGDSGVATSDEIAVSNLGGDLFVLWRRAIEYNGHSTVFDIYSVSDVQRQRDDPSCHSCVAGRMRFVSVQGTWVSGHVALSSDGRYAAGPWASNNQLLGSQAMLAIVDLQKQSEDGTAQVVFNPPGDAGDKVDLVQWINATQFIVRNTSGRKFAWTIGTHRWVELPAMPAQFNGYSLLSEFYAPDGMSYAGLMSKDGGRTHEVWASDYDYKNMRQITQAGLKLTAPQWLATSTLLRIDFEGDNARGIINHCNAAVVNPDVASQLSAQQLVAAALPEKMTCTHFHPSLMP